MTPLRGLAALRLSVLTDETTSPERQRAACREAAAAEGIALRHEAVDLGVSASRTTPFDRPKLGAWLRQPADFDAIVCWRFDRLVRSMDDMHALSAWAKEHRKVIVFAEGPGGRLKLDFRNPLDPMAQLIVTVFAFAAQMEAQAIKERVTGAQAAMRQMPLRWRGSRPPYGYAPAELEGGGWTLAPDPDAVSVLESVITDLERGKTLSSIAIELNRSGVLSPRDAWAQRQGRPLGDPKKGVERFQWSSSTLRARLSSLALVGWKVSDGKPVRDPEGNPVPCTAEPILTRSEYDAVQGLLGVRSTTHGERVDTDALLLRVAHCAGCQGRMYLDKRGHDSPGYYRCVAAGQGRYCEKPVTVRADWLEEWSAQEFLRLLGGVRVTERRTVPGYDPQPEIDATLAEYEDHQAQQGRQKSKAGKAAWQARADALDARLAELESRERVEPREDVVVSEHTYADQWAREDTAGRRRMMAEAGVRVDVRRGTPGGWRKLDVRRVSMDIRDEFYAAAAEEALAVEHAERAWA